MSKMQEKCLYIRADGNEKLGIGHLMRCFVIAREWRMREAACCFLVSDETSAQLVREQGFEAVTLNSRWDNLDQELDGLKELLEKRGAEILLLDSYYYSENYVRTLGEICTVAALGDRANNDCPADIVINYNIYAEENVVQQPESRTVRLLGTKYFPLRTEFFGKRVTVQRTVDRIYLSAGGTDQFKVLLPLAKKLLAKGYEVEAVTGRFNEQLLWLEQLEKENNKFHLHVDAKCVSAIMKNCQIAISAAGITLYELCAMGIPTITFAFADNQIKGAEAMCSRNIMLGVGDIRGQLPQKIDQIIEKVRALDEQLELRQEFSRRMQDCVDGKGASRISDVLGEHAMRKTKER